MRRLFCLSLLLLMGCRYAHFAPIDDQPTKVWVPNAEIGELSQVVSPIRQSLIVQGVVVANDSTGNFYKQIILVDRHQSASLAVSIGYYDSFSQFSQGSVVAVELEGLILSKVDGLLTAGYPPIAPDTIPAPISSVSLALRHLNFQGERIVLPDVERRFDQIELSDIGLPFLFTQAYFQTALGTYAGEHIVCRVPRDTLIRLYTSPYASFASDPVPSSVFDLRAIVMSHKGEIQLKIRNKI